MTRRLGRHATVRALALLVLAAPSLYGGSADAAICEVEPTDMSVDYGEQVTCSIAAGGDTDLFRFSGVAGDRVLAEAVFVSGINFSPRINFVAPNGTLILDTWAPARVDHVLLQTGTYTAIILDQGANVAGNYAFMVSCLAGGCAPQPPPPPAPAPGGDIDCEPEPTDMFPHYGTRVTCAVSVGDTDLYRFAGNAGDRILAEAVFLSGVNFNPRIAVIAPDGALVLDTYAPARVDRTLLQTGVYTAVVYSLTPGVGGTYAFTVSCTGGTCLPGPSPTVTLTLTGCTLCHTGDQFTVQARWTNPRGAAVRVELKAGLRLPDGTTTNTLGNRHLEVVLPPMIDVTANLMSFPWPAGLASGTWTFEGALLGRDLGETFAREVKTFIVAP